MIKEKIIGMLVGIFILLLACSERDENESLINSDIMGTEKVDVSLSLSLPELQIESNTDYRPMSTRVADDEVKALIVNKYRCLVLKEIGGTWYVEAYIEPLLKEGEGSELLVTDNPVFDNLQLTLRPGHYQVLVILNSERTTLWNKNLVPGAVVKNQSDTITHACTYRFQAKDAIHANKGERQLSKEVFSGTVDFRITKTRDLHSPVAISGNTEIALTRRVAKLRFLLKDHPVDVEGSSLDYNFYDTEFTLYSTVKVTQEGEYFCDGLDCWGNAYYNRTNPTTQMKIIMSINMDWQAAAGEHYKMTVPAGTTIYSPFVFTDTTKVVHYQVENILITGQSESPSIQHVYRGPITGLILRNDSVQPLVFQATDKVKMDEEVHTVTLEYLQEESEKVLFPPYYECKFNSR